MYILNLFFAEDLLLYKTYLLILNSFFGFSVDTR